MTERRPPRQVRIVALIVWFLSRKADLGVYYVVSRKTKYDLDGLDLRSAAAVALFMANWLSDANVKRAVHAGLTSIDNHHRIVADMFLMHSLLLEYVMKQNAKGIAVDLTQGISQFIRLWSHRPMATQVQSRLAQMVWSRSARRRFGVCFRREWNLCFNSFQESRELSETDIRTRVRNKSRGLE